MDGYLDAGGGAMLGSIEPSGRPLPLSMLYTYGSSSDPSRFQGAMDSVHECVGCTGSQRGEIDRRSPRAQCCNCLGWGAWPLGSHQ